MFLKTTTNNMKLIPFLYKTTDPTSTSSSSAPWQWPACGGNLKTVSFRASPDDIIFRMANSTFATDPPDISFTSSDSGSVSGDEVAGDPVETVIKGLSLRSERLFFEPVETSSILNKKKNETTAIDEDVYKESEVVSMDSEDPYGDFRRSMEEMVEAHGIKDWDGIEELLSWYLKVNLKSNHGYIVGAFIDLLVGLSFTESSSSSASSSFTISHSSLPSSPLSSSLPSSSLPLDQGDDQS